MISKLKKRLFQISLNTINSLITPLFNILLSLIVIRFCSKELWGEVVGIMLWIGIALNISSFGNKEYMLREFSLRPLTSVVEWQKSATTRFLFLLISLLLFFFLYFSITIYLSTCIILLARYIYQSYEPAIIFKRKFSVTIFLETITFLGNTVFILVFQKSIELGNILLIFATTELIKTTIIILLMKSTIPAFRLSVPQLNYLSILFPFFIINFIAMLSSKIDLICVNHFLLKEDIAKYQVLLNFLLLIQASSNFILLPFVKNIYRMNIRQINKLSLTLTAMGIPIALLSIVVLYFLLPLIFHFSFALPVFILSFVFVLPIFYYLPVIYLLLKLNQQKKLVLINAISLIVNLLLNLIFIPIYGISGALLSIAITQTIILLIYFFILKFKIALNDEHRK